MLSAIAVIAVDNMELETEPNICTRMGTVSCWARAQSRGGGEQWFSCTWIVAVVWWLIVGRDTPEDHPRWAYHGGADDVSGGIKQGIQVHCIEEDERMRR
eukprot:283825_1